MTIVRSSVFALVFALMATLASAQQTNPIERPAGTMTAAAYDYVEIVGPRDYYIVAGDKLYDLTANQWRQLQAANAKLNDSWRISTTRSGLYRVHLTINERITIPDGMKIRVRLTRPENFVTDPVHGGTPFVNGGVNANDPSGVRRQMQDQALRDFNNRNPGSNLRAIDFAIEGNIEQGRLYGPGVVYFADQPNQGRPTIYNGERAYRAMVRNLRTGQTSQQVFLQECGNDARRGDSVRAAGDGFRFVPEGTPIPGTDPPGIRFRNLGLLVLGLGALFGFGYWALSRNYPARTTTTPIAATTDEPVVVGAVTSDELPAQPEAIVEAAAPASASPDPSATPVSDPPAAPPAMPETTTTPTMTFTIGRTRFTAPASDMRAEHKDGKTTVSANGTITVEELPEVTRPREVRRRRKTEVATGTN